MRLGRYCILAGVLLCTPSFAQASEPTLPELVAKVKPAVGTILVHQDEDATPDSQGTAWFLANGQIVTNRHVVSQARRAELRLSDGRVGKITGVLADDLLRDLVLLGVDIKTSPDPLPLASTPVREGESVFVIGSPLGLAQTVSEGIISSVRLAGDLGTVVQTTAAISPGSSGSPILNLQGAVVGVATLQFVKGQALNFGVSVDSVRSLKAGTPVDLGVWSATTVAPTATPRTLADLEISRASHIGSTPHPAVLKMTPAQYRQALDGLHPAFRPSESDLTRAIAYGGAMRKKSYEDLFGHFSKGAGRDTISPFVPIRSAIYAGWDDARDFKPLPEAATFAPTPDHRLQFGVYMGRYNNSRELRDPRFVLQLPDGTYVQPEVAPKPDQDTPKSTVYSGVRSFYNYFTKRMQYYSYSDTYFSKSYTVWFDLLNPDGTPRIKPDAKEITLILSLDGEEKRVKFKLENWTADALPKVKK